MNDIFQEVDEALKQEKFEKIWHDHKEKIVTTIVGFILLTAAFTFYKSWDRNRDGEATAVLYEVTENKEYSTLDEATNSVQSVGYLIAGGETLETDKKKAAEYFTDASNKTSKRDLKDLATLYSVNFKEDSDVNAIKNVANDKKSAWQFHAALQKSALLAEDKNYEDAIKALDTILNSSIVAPTLKQRAEAMAHIFTIEKNNMIVAENNADSNKESTEDAE